MYVFSGNCYSPRDCLILASFSPGSSSVIISVDLRDNLIISRVRRGDLAKSAAAKVASGSMIVCGVCLKYQLKYRTRLIDYSFGSPLRVNSHSRSLLPSKSGCNDRINWRLRTRQSVTHKALGGSISCQILQLRCF